MTNDQRLRLLKSDLKDCKDPKVVSKYPHLAKPELAAQLENQIKALEGGDK